MQISLGDLVSALTPIITGVAIVAYLKARIDSLTDHVKQQNSRIGKCEDWRQDHMEFHMEKKK